MSQRTPYAGGIVAGDDVTAANNNRLPGGWCLHVASSSAVTNIDTTTVDITGMAAPSFTMSTSRVYKHTFDIVVSGSNGPETAVNVFLTDGSDTVLRNFRHRLNSTGSLETITGTFVEVGSGASEVRKLRINFGAGLGAVQASTAGCASQYTIEDIGSTT